MHPVPNNTAPAIADFITVAGIHVHDILVPCHAATPIYCVLVLS